MPFFRRDAFGLSRGVRFAGPGDVRPCLARNETRRGSEVRQSVGETIDFNDAKIVSPMPNRAIVFSDRLGRTRGVELFASLLSGLGCSLEGATIDSGFASSDFRVPLERLALTRANVIGFRAHARRPARNEGEKADQVMHPNAAVQPAMARRDPEVALGTRNPPSMSAIGS